MPPSSILVLGLGELGRNVVESLAMHPQRADTKLSVLVRSRKPEQVAQLQKWNVGIVLGNVDEDSENELSNTLAPYHTIICCVGMYAPPPMQVKIARAVLAARVQRYFPWQFGLNYDVIGRNSSQDLFDSQLDVRAVLRSQQRTQWVIVSTGLFTSFLFEPAFGLVSEDRSVITGIGSWENELTVTSPEDIGRLVAEIALAHQDIQGVVYASGDTISMHGLADVVEEATGKQVTRILKTVPQLKEELKESPTDAMRKYRVVFAEGKGVAWSKAESFNGVRGIRTQTVDEWVAENI